MATLVFSKDGKLNGIVAIVVGVLAALITGFVVVLELQSPVRSRDYTGLIPLGFLWAMFLFYLIRAIYYSKKAKKKNAALNAMAAAARPAEKSLESAYSNLSAQFTVDREGLIGDIHDRAKCFGRQKLC